VIPIPRVSRDEVMRLAFLRAVRTKVVNSVSVGVSFFQLERNVSVSECFDVPFRGCTIYIYIYIYIFNKHNSNSR